MSIESNILQNYRTIAVVGLSSDPATASNSVAAYLKNHGYTIIPVNPTETEVLGEKAYPDLHSVPVPVDVVQIFRRSEHVPPIVEDAIRIGAKAIWMQQGIAHEGAAQRAREGGLTVVMDSCMRTEHRMLAAND